MNELKKVINVNKINLENLTTTTTDELRFRVVTPLAIHGADSKTAEIRTQSINGILRYWSRALRTNDISTHNQEVESVVFGSAFADNPTKGKVQLRLNRVPKKLRPIEYGPSSTGNFAIEGLEPNTEFSLRVGVEAQSVVTINDTAMLIGDYIKALTLVTTMIGGFGQRARHGVGSVDPIIIQQRFINTDSYTNFLQAFLTKLGLKVTKNGNLLSRIEGDLSDGAPFWKGTTIIDTRTNDYEVLLEAVKRATHKLSMNYRGVIGSAKPRFPSPLYTSVTQKTNNNYNYIVTVSEIYNPNMYNAIDLYEEAKNYYIEQLKLEIK